MTGRLHVVFDPDRWSRPEQMAKEVAAAGADAIHLRMPGGKGADILRTGSALLDGIGRHPCRLVINDRIDVAMALGARSVQLPERSFPISDARRLLGPEAWIGMSRHDAEGVGSGVRPDWFLVGHVFSTRSHPGRSPLGLAGLREIVSSAGPTPVIAIGGIVEARVRSVVDAGAAGVAIFGAAFDEGTPGRVVDGVRRALDAREVLPCGS